MEDDKRNPSKFHNSGKLMFAAQRGLYKMPKTGNGPKIFLYFFMLSLTYLNI